MGIELSDAKPQFCGVEESQRDECGWPGIDAEHCSRLGCCYQRAEKAGVPFCFFDNNPVCAVADVDRRECGHPGTKMDECLQSSGCCWAKGDASPWCFHSKRGVEWT